MDLIQEFEYVKDKNPLTGEFIYTKGEIKTEVNRSQINFYNSEGKFIEVNWKKVNIYQKKLSAYGNFNKILNKNELEFLSNKYGLTLISDTERGVFRTRASLKHINEGYLPGMMEYFIADNKEYLIISFDRKTEHLPPQAQEDKTYVLGIWESPLLTNEIIEKIKQP